MTLKCENISKLYGDTAALSHVELELGRGIYGLLGPNGAGKTTLMRIMTDLLEPSAGRVTLDGADISSLGADYRARLGYLPQELGLYPGFTAEQFLLYIARLKGIERETARRQCGELLELVGLTHKANKKLRGFSGGEKQRVGLAQALLGSPDILILDEPTSGLDPAERMRLRDVLGALSTRSTVLLSTHIVSDLSVVANEVILLNSGAVIVFDSPANLLSPLRGRVWQVSCGSEAEAEFTGRYPCSGVRRDMGVSTLRLISDEPPSRDAIEAEPNMEDMYLWYFKR